jgi:hypothetical protein
MTTPSTANSKDVGTTVRPVADKGAVGPSATHSVVKGEVGPRLPHERDESSDSGTVQPSEVMRKAADDAQSGRTDVERSPQTQGHYSDLTARASKRGKPGPKTGG